VLLSQKTTGLNSGRTSGTGGWYLRPTTDEVAALIVEGEDGNEMSGDKIVHQLDGNLQLVYGTHTLIWLYNIHSYFRIEQIGGEWEFLLLGDQLAIIRE